VERNFFASRTAAEIGMNADAVALLEERANSERAAVDEAMKQFEQQKTSKTPAPAASEVATSATPVAAARMVPSPVSEGPAPDPELPKRLEQVERQIREMEDTRQRQIGDLKAQLSQLEATYTPAHPLVIAQRKNLDSFAQEPASLTALRGEYRKLLDQVSRDAGDKLSRARSLRGFSGTVGATIAAAPSDKPLSGEALQFADPKTAAALNNVQNSIRKYQDCMDRLDAAKLELEGARAAFKYRYAEFRPADVSDKPLKSPYRYAGMGFGFGFLLAVLLPLGLDLLGGRFLEIWQVRQLGLPVLGELPKP
jgi:hypothetical protein